MKLIDEFKYALWEDTDGTAYEVENKCEKIASEFAIEFAKWCLKQFKKAPSGKKFVFKHQNKVVADEHTIEEMYNIFIIDKNYSL